jgi:hypothetical protein
MNHPKLIPLAIAMEFFSLYFYHYFLLLTERFPINILTINIFRKYGFPNFPAIFPDILCYLPCYFLIFFPVIQGAFLRIKPG